jgi:hypothetical protein
VYVDDRLVEMEKADAQHSKISLVMRVREIVCSWEDCEQISSKRMKVPESPGGNSSIVWLRWKGSSPL